MDGIKELFMQSVPSMVFIVILAAFPDSSITVTALFYIVWAIFTGLWLFNFPEIAETGLLILAGVSGFLWGFLEHSLGRYTCFLVWVISLLIYASIYLF